MPHQNNKTVPASYLILRRGEEVLLMRRQGSGYYDGWYSVPAGHIEEGELPITCLVRETKEEIGVDIATTDIQFAHVMYRTKQDETGDRVDYFFVATRWSGEPAICEPHKCDDLQWFSVNALPDNTVPFVRQAIGHAKKTNYTRNLATLPPYHNIASAGV